MGLGEYTDGKMKVRKDLEVPDKSYIVKELEEGIHKRQKEDKN